MTRNYPQYIKPSGKVVTRTSQLQRLGEANDYIRISRDNWRLVAVVSMVVAFVLATVTLL